MAFLLYYHITTGKLHKLPGGTALREVERFLKSTSGLIEGDKKPEDATTVQELVELYQSQGKR